MGPVEAMISATKSAMVMAIVSTENREQDQPEPQYRAGKIHRQHPSIIQGF